MYKLKKFYLKYFKNFYTAYFAEKVEIMRYFVYNNACVTAQDMR